MTIVMRPSCWHKNFGPNRLSAPTQGLCLNFFSSLTTDFNISSALRWAIQDQWSSSQRSSSPKPLGQSKPNFMWSLHGSGERKFVRASGSHDQDGHHAQIWYKPFKNLLLWNQRANDLGPWYVALGPWAHQSLFKWWPWVDLDLFYGKVKFGPLCFYMGKTVRKTFNGRNLQQMTRVTWGICYIEILMPGGWLPRDYI